MNMHALKQGLTIASNAVEALATANDNLSAGKKKNAVALQLKEAKERLKEAEARIAHELGFPICRRCWPPEIMVHNDDGEFICKGCGKAMPPGTSPEIPNFDDLATW